MPSNLISWIIYIISALLLGAVANGLWGWVLEPLFKKVSRIALTFITLWARSIKNKYYKEIARRPSNKASISILSLILMAILFLTGTVVGEYTYFITQKNIGNESTIDKVIHEWNEILSLGKTEPQKAKEKLSLLLKTSAENRLHAEVNFLKVKLSAAVFFAIIIFITHVKANYISSAIFYFDQCMSICKPFISEAEKLDFYSKFALLKCRDDYIVLINKLDETARNQGLSLPYFWIL